MTQPFNLSANQQRAHVYRLLSACYYQPEAQFVEEDVFGQLHRALACLDAELAAVALDLDQAFCSADLDALLLDYTRLFLGPFEIKAKPYGSIYLEGDSVVMGDSTINALACYREAEFEVDENFHEVPDHVAVELEFLYLLCFKQNEAAVNCDQSELIRWREFEQVFLKNHLQRWIGEFCTRIKNGAEGDFYRLLAQETETFVLQQMR